MITKPWQYESKGVGSEMHQSACEVVDLERVEIVHGAANQHAGAANQHAGAANQHAGAANHYTDANLHAGSRNANTYSYHTGA